MTETPCVFIDVQRGGPSTGLPTLPAQADMMQVRWGSHGDYEIIALCPNSPQECFDLTVAAFNLAEQYRVPVFVMLDEVVGHMTEKVVIPPADQIDVTPRRYTTIPPSEFKAYEPKEDLVPDMPRTGQGYNLHVTGLTHDERGYPNMKPATQDKLVCRLCDKITKNADKICMYEEEAIDGSDVVVVSYGITSRVAQRAIELARAKGVEVGKFRLITAWPFPEKKMKEVAARTKAVVVTEINLGQMVREVERAVAGEVPVKFVGHAGGSVHNPEDILKAIMEVAR
jgi:2-oxoglutarate ferredoxin oxidoreductase subunit alpha